jgi:hypothetical protein
MFPNHSTVVAGVNVIHLKFEKVMKAVDKALNYGLRRGSVGVFNSRIKSAKVVPSGPSCTGPAG